MHASVMDFARSVLPLVDLDLPILEVGSLDVNGSVRSVFPQDLYVGVDMQDGPGVDLVLNAHDLDRELCRTYGTILSTEMLEHDDAPWVSVAQMRSVALDGAILLLTARGYDERGCFPLHDYPGDHWRFSVTGMEHLLRQCGWTPLRVERDPEAPGVLAVARAD